MKGQSWIKLNSFLFFVVFMLAFFALLMVFNANEDESSFAVNAVKGSEKESIQVIETIRKAEAEFYRPFEYTKQAKLKGKNVRLFTEPYASTDALFKHFRQHWHDSMADELASQSVDWKSSKNGKGLVANPNFNTFDVLHVNDNQLKLVKLEGDTAIVEAFVDDDAGKQHKIVYELIKDFNSAWVIKKKTVS